MIERLNHTRGCKNFLRKWKNFSENMLHAAPFFVQLLTSAFNASIANRVNHEYMRCSAHSVVHQRRWLKACFGEAATHLIGVRRFVIVGPLKLEEAKELPCEFCVRPADRRHNFFKEIDCGQEEEGCQEGSEEGRQEDRQEEGRQEGRQEESRQEEDGQEEDREENVVPSGRGSSSR